MTRTPIRNTLSTFAVAALLSTFGMPADPAEATSFSVLLAPPKSPAGGKQKSQSGERPQQPSTDNRTNGNRPFDAQGGLP